MAEHCMTAPLLTSSDSRSNYYDSPPCTEHRVAVGTAVRNIRLLYKCVHKNKLLSADRTWFTKVIVSSNHCCENELGITFILLVTCTLYSSINGLSKLLYCIREQQQLVISFNP